jgi:hypothetical protein
VRRNVAWLPGARSCNLQRMFYRVRTACERHALSGNRARAFFGLSLALLLPCCASSKDSEPAVSAVGGPVAGAADEHCGTNSQATSVYACQSTSSRAMPIGGRIAPLHEADASLGSSYGPVLFGTSGADDDCKYDMSWSSSEIRRDVDVTFSLRLTARATSTPAKGAAPYPQIYLNESHAAPETNPLTTEGEPGTYQIGPVRFDAPGRWTVRFHAFPTCADLSPDSPHGHAAFYVDVP